MRDGCLLSETRPDRYAADAYRSCATGDLLLLDDWSQGYLPSGTATVLGVSNSYKKLQQLYSSSQAWKRGYKLSPSAACSKRSRSSLCAAEDTQASDSVAQLQMATSPSSYSSVNASQVGDIRLVAAPGDQLSCQTCTAFAVTSAAETSMAAAVGVPVDECSISVQGLYFCEPDSPSKSCTAGWTLPEALRQLQQRSSTIVTASCLPYKPDEWEQLTPQEMCEGRCSYANKHASQGRFSSKQISSVWAAQQHIRLYGAVITRFDVYSDFKTFFNKFSNAQAVYRPSKDAQFHFGHAVVLVGYNNDHDPPYWIAKNSYGPGWGDGGFFKVAFDTCSVLTAGTAEAYGLIWTPLQRPAALQLQVTSAAPAHPGCFWYKVRGAVAVKSTFNQGALPLLFLLLALRCQRHGLPEPCGLLAGIPLDKFMLDNTGAVRDLDAPLAGLSLLLCGPAPGRVVTAGSSSPGSGGGGGGGGAPKVTQAAQTGNKPSTAADPQLESLLQIKQFIDTAGVLNSWDRQAGQNKGYCRSDKWVGVSCTSDKQVVVGITLSQNNIQGSQGVNNNNNNRNNNYNNKIQQGLTGQLPPASAFQGLRGLTVLDISFQQGLVGNLPPDWSSLQQLKHVQLVFTSVAGTLPPSWGQLRQLKKLKLFGNQLSGPLPDAYRALTAMEDLQLHINSLSGTLPSSWGQLRQLKLRQLGALRLQNNKLSGPLPDAYKSLTELIGLDLCGNSFSGSVPPSWSSMTSLKLVLLYGNPKLSGCLPTSWRQQLTSSWDVQDNIVSGTALKGFC
eukprot:gene3414-biopygen5106